MLQRALVFALTLTTAGVWSSPEAASVLPLREDDTPLDALMVHELAAPRMTMSA